MALWLVAAHWIAQPWGTIALLVAGCLLLYHDLLTPLTWGVTGTLGVIAVALVFAAQLTVGVGGYFGVIVLLAGLAAILLEVHVIPGRGSALGGFVLMFAGMFLALGGTRNLFFALSVTAFLTVVTGVAFLAYLPKSPAWQRIGSQLHRRAQLARHEPEASAGLVGHHGRVLTRLNPTGYAKIDGIRLSVVTEGEFLEPGASVVVTQAGAGRIVVHDASETQSDLAAAEHAA
jgi:membrane-bound serine protease (ClpP class)